MGKKSFFRKGLEKIILTASGLLLLNNISTAQTTSLNISGTTTNTQNQPLAQTELTFKQYKEGNWEHRGQTTSNNNGEFSKYLDTITNLKETQSITPINYITLDNKGFLSATDNTQLTHAVYTVPLMQEILKEQINLKQGDNDLPKNNFNRLANSHYFETYSNKHGVINRLITIQNGQITHESVKGNRTIKIPLKNQTPKKLTKNKITNFTTHPDSIYIMTIATKNEYKPDTNITSMHKNQIQDITGLELKLQQTSYNIPLTMKNFLHQPQPNEKLILKDPETNQKLEYITNENGKTILTPPKTFGPNIHIWFKPQNQPDTNYINYQTIQDSINFGKKNLYNPKIQDNQIQNYIETNLDTLQQQINQNNPLTYKILKRYSETNNQPGFNGTYDLTNTNHRSFLLNSRSGIMRKFNANITDTLHIFISDYIHHNDQATTELATETDINWRDEWLEDYQKIWNEPEDNWKYMNFTIHKVNDIYNNEKLNEIKNTIGNRNYILVPITDHLGPGNIVSFEDGTNQLLFGEVYFLNGGSGFFIFNSELAGPLLPQEELNSTYAWNPASTSSQTPPSDSTPYKNTKFNETGAKLMMMMWNIDQNYKFPKKKYESRND